VERARDLLGSNGFAHGHGLPTFKLGCLDHPLEQNVCRALMQGWAKVGLQTEKVTLDARARRKAILQGEIDLWPITWVADLPAPASYLEVFSGSSESSLSGLPEIPNLGKASEKLEKILNRIRMAPSTVLLQQSVDEAVDLINLESPAVFLLHRFQFWLVKKGWKGIGLEDFSWHDSDQVSITLQKDEPKRE
jgi:ABC-type oligopeptide transport system substrate-binding subunit